jgi:hypothetical protein
MRIVKGDAARGNELDVAGDMSLSRGSGNNAGALYFGAVSNKTQIYGDSTNNLLAFYTSGAEKVRIDSNGNVGIGTTNPGIAKTYVSNAGGGVGLYVGNGTPFGQSYIEQDGPAATHIYMAENGSAVFYVLSGGRTYATAFLYASDRRLKENIAPLDNALYKLLQITGVSFDWRPGTPQAGKHDVGVIAQDVQKVLPEAVTTNPATGMLAVDYPRLVPLVIDAVKELAQKLYALTTTVSGFAQSITSTVGNFGRVNTDDVHTKELCVSKSNGTDICVTGDQLAALLAK